MSNISAPLFSSWDNVYPGPHIDDDGKLDDRIWYSIPVNFSKENSTITYIIFPHGGSEDEIKEVTIDANGFWLG